MRQGFLIGQNYTPTDRPHASDAPLQVDTPSRARPECGPATLPDGPSRRLPSSGFRDRRASDHNPPEEPMSALIHVLMRSLVALALAIPLAVSGQQPITLHGAVQFDDNHPFNKSLLKFEELVKKYYGKPVSFVLHRNSELGLEKDYFAYMSQGISVDYGVVSPAHMSTFAKAAPILDMPFLFRDLDHWNKVLDSDAFQPIIDDVAKKADVMIIGYDGGGTRNIIANKPIRNMAELRGFTMRVMGAPIQTQMFTAIGAKPSVIAYNEVYNAIQTGVIQGAENEAAGLDAMKFYEVGPNISLTQHAITVRPICFSGKTFRKLPPDLQAAILKAGKEAGKYGRDLESGGDSTLLAKLEKEGKLKTWVFTDRAKLLDLAEPVKQAYAKEIDATDILAKVNAIR
jgi:tripartite ATP-independent transporter DctP family solute receptor